MQFVKNTWNRNLGGKVLIGCGGLLSILCLCAVASSVISPRNATTPTTAAPTGKATSAVVVTIFESPTETSVAPTSTPAPTPTFVSTDTPEPTPTLAPTTEPIRFEGSGDSVVDVPEHRPSIIHITGNKSSRFFAVESYDANGEKMDLLVNTADPYDGTRPFDFYDQEKTTRLQVSATGAWQIEILPLSMARHEQIPGTLAGQGDDVLILLGGTPDTAKVSGNKSSRFFAVMSYTREGNKDLLVNTADPYDGEVLLNADTIILEVQASDTWTIEVTTK